MKLLRKAHSFLFDTSVQSHGSKVDSTPISKRCNAHSQDKVSIVSAVYGVEPYIDEFISSVVKQSIGFEKNIELILVDDCSVDGSYEKCLEWESKYPNNIKVIKLESNQGQASARNEGIKLASHEWINFADPDDCFHVNFFKHMYRAIRANPDCDLFVGQLRSFYESTGREINDHPIGWRFKKGVYSANVMNVPNSIHCHVNNSMFLASKIRRAGIRFNPELRPAYEDAVFVHDYTISEEAHDRCFVQNARYIYRKRGDASSTLDTCWSKPEKYINQLKFGHLHMIKSSIEKFGFIPMFVQNTIIYDLSWYFKRMINKPLNELPLSFEEAIEFEAILGKVLSKITPRAVVDFNVTNVDAVVRSAMLTYCATFFLRTARVYLRGARDSDRVVRVNYMTQSPDSCISAVVNGRKQSVEKEKKVIVHSMLGSKLVYEHFSWLKVDLFDSSDELSIGQSNVMFAVRGKACSNSLSNSDLLSAGLKMSFGGRQPNNHEKKLLADYRKMELGLNGYKDCWLLHDRPEKADDNGEHLMRYILNHRQDINAFYAIKRNSKDWHRLEAEGFPLVAFNSIEHHYALLNAKEYISSHANSTVEVILPKVVFGEHLTYNYHFIQHGVIKDDLSKWLNSKPFSTFVTSSPAEYDSIALDGSRYSFTDEVVALCGLPRHDELYRRRHEAVGNTVLIMPTWRKSLKAQKGESDSSYNDRFLSSSFYKNWQGLILSKEMRALNDQGYNIEFFLHAEIAENIDKFTFPEWIKIIRPNDFPMQDLFAKSKLLLTDYSSVSFDMAALNRMTMYFQFDSDEFFQSHSYDKGYFDYKDHGFGQVCENLSDMREHLRSLFKCYDSIMNDVVIPRSSMALPFVNGNSCERLVQVIESKRRVVK